MPQLKAFIKPHIEASGVNVTLTLVEPKASGKSLVQILRQETNIPITEIKSKFIQMSKIEMARASSPSIEGGRVFLVEGLWNESFLKQIAVFPNGKHDEHIDLTSYAIERNLMRGSLDLR